MTDISDIERLISKVNRLLADLAVHVVDNDEAKRVLADLEDALRELNEAAGITPPA
jgi:uncharacterized protein YoxC